MTFTTTAKKKLSPEEEHHLDVLDTIEFQYKKTTKNPSFAELLEIFPDAIPAATRAAKSAIKEIKKNISSLSDFRETCSEHVNSVSFKQQPELIKYYDDLIARLLEAHEKELKKYQYQLNYIDNLKHPEKKPKGDTVTPEMIERAKRFPIRELLEVKRGTSLCLWHDDTRPSMKIYDKDNRVWCFSCAHGGDPIDVYMALNGCDFRTAVRKLAV